MMEQQLGTQTESQQRMAQLESAMAELSKYVVRLETLSRQREEQLEAERRTLRRLVDEQAARSWWQLVAAILAGGLLGAGLLHGFQRLQSTRGRPMEPPPAPMPAPAATTVPPAAAFADVADDDYPIEVAPPAARAPVPRPAPASAPPRPGPRPAPEPVEFTPPAFAPPPPPPPPAATAPSMIKFGTTPLRHPEDEALELVNIMMSMGLKEGAADTLVQHIREYPRQSLHHWLKLLELHRHSGNQAAYEQTVREMRSHFNVQAADWEDDGAVHVSQSLEDFPHIRSQLVAAWGTPACAEYLQHLLTDNREGTRLGFPIGPTEDILLLAILRDDPPDAQ